MSEDAARLQLLYIYCIYNVGMSLPHARDMSPLIEYHQTNATGITRLESYVVD